MAGVVPFWMAASSLLLLTYFLSPDRLGHLYLPCFKVGMGCRTHGRDILVRQLPDLCRAAAHMRLAPDLRRGDLSDPASPMAMPRRANGSDLCARA